MLSAVWVVLYLIIYAPYLHIPSISTLASKKECEIRLGSYPLGELSCASHTKLNIESPKRLTLKLLHLATLHINCFSVVFFFKKCYNIYILITFGERKMASLSFKNPVAKHNYHIIDTIEARNCSNWN